MRNKRIVVAAALALAFTSCTAGTAWLITEHSNKAPAVVKSGNGLLVANTSSIKGDSFELGFTLKPEPGLATAPVKGRSYSQEILGPGLSSKVSSWIAASSGADLTNADNASAFQLGLWEIMSGDSVLNLNTGDFQLVGGNTYAATIAESWFSNYTFNSYSEQYTVFSHPGKDDIIVIPPSPIPEVPTYMLMLAGFLGIAYVRSRSTTK